MTVFRTVVRAATFACAAVAALPAAAATYSFTFTGAYTGSFSIAANPASAFSVSGARFDVENVAGTFEDSTVTAQNLVFYSQEPGFFGWNQPGGLMFDTEFVRLTGKTLYAGTEANPTFKIGTFFLERMSLDAAALGSVGIGGASAPTSNQVQLVIAGPSAPGAVPEPATWAMMIGGFGLIGGAMRRRMPAARPA